MISREYRAMLAESHEKNPNWGTSARKHGPIVEKLIDHNEIKSILDYGCGKGELFKSISPKVMLSITTCEYDPAIPGKEYIRYPKFDMVCCLDVLEHIEPEHLQDVLDDLASHTGKLGYFVISCRKAKHILPDGRNAHLIVKPPKWWDEVIKAHFPKYVVSVNHARKEAIYLVAGKDFKGEFPDLP